MKASHKVVLRLIGRKLWVTRDGEITPDIRNAHHFETIDDADAAARRLAPFVGAMQVRRRSSGVLLKPIAGLPDPPAAASPQENLK